MLPRRWVALVSCLRSPRTKSRDGGQDLISRLRPHDGLGCLIGDVQVGLDGRLQFTQAAMSATTDLFFGERSEPTFVRFRQNCVPAWGHPISPGNRSGQNTAYRGGGRSATGGRSRPCSHPHDITTVQDSREFAVLGKVSPSF